VNQAHRLTLRNDRVEIARLPAWIDTLSGTLGLSSRTVHAVQLCLEEAVTNIVSHAFAPGTVHDVQVALWRDGTILHAEVTDDGRPFDPLTYALSAAPKDLESAAIGGLGIKLMRSFADGVAYRRSGAMNRLTLSFLISESMPKRIGGPQGPEPTRCGDRAVNGRRGDL
jgi:anti-sigma regulatory factor (Ser/Thr protein kinase)